VPASESIKTPPDAPKPSRRRAVVVCAVFAVVLAATIYLLRTNLAYLKWRFIGREHELIYDALETGAISADQVVKLVNSGATAEVRSAALGAVAASSRIQPPYDDRIVTAIELFAADLPEAENGKWGAAHAVVAAVRRTRQSALMPVLKTLAGDTDPEVRMCVAGVLGGDADLSEESRALVRMLAKDPHPAVRVSIARALYRKDAPDWTVPILRRLLEDADAQVRESATIAAHSCRREDGANPFSSRLREMLDSPTEDEDVRDAALGVLCHGGALGDEDLAALANDPQERVAETAKRLIKLRDAERKAEREAARNGSPPDE
jgi:hypothetical protein